MLLEVGQRARCALEHLVHDGLHVVAGNDRPMQRRRSDGKALRQMQLEFAQARETQGSTEADDRRRADLRPARQRVDVGAQREIRIREHDRGDLPLPLRERLGTLAHREQEIAYGAVHLVVAFGRAIHVT